MKFSTSLPFRCVKLYFAYMSKQGKKPRLSPNVGLYDHGRSGREASTSSSGIGPGRRKLASRNVRSDSETDMSTCSVTEPVKSVIFRTEIIDKSPNDAKSYRHIELRNGLRALLISDPNEGISDTAVSGGSKSDRASGQSSEGLSKASQSESSSSSEEEEEEEEEEDDDKSTVKLSAAGLCIGSGSFCDPPEAQGLAHFLEHMVFMGSEKYPEENAYDSFIKKHGGDDNASTDCEKTLFYFDIQHEVFKQALDMFAQFFISPLLNKASIHREIQAVDSEFEQSVTSDFVRKQQLMAHMVTEGHPVGTFMWGNSESLIKGEDVVVVHKQLQDFHRQMYSAQYMTLAIQAEETLDNLEEWVVETFSRIPNNGQPPRKFTDHGEVFDPSKFCKLYKVIPVKNLNQIEITWSVPSQLHHYRSKPLGYLSFLVGHEGKGSILSYLKKRCWALGLYGGTGDAGFEHNSANALFSVTITLTEEGLNNYYQVLTSVFQYLAMLKREGPQKRIFDEIKRVDEIDFVWQEECDPTDNVEDLCAEMQLYPPQYYLSGGSLLMDYEPKLISDCLEKLTPQTCNIIILSKTFEDQNVCDRTEKWYKTRYSVTDIDPAWILRWENINCDPELHLPGPNQFIATDFNIKTVDVDTTVKEVHKPVVILNNEQTRLWYKKNNQFNVPKAYIYFHLITPMANQTPQTMVLFDLFLRLLKQNLTEQTYPANLAQLWYDFKGLETGMTIKLGGFNHKLPRLFELIVDNLAEFETSREMFEAVKDQASRDYFNHFIRPARLITDVRLAILQQKYWTAVDKRCFIGQITRETLMSFVQELKMKLYIEGLIIGNLCAEEAMRMEEYLCKRLNCAILPRNTRPELRGIQLPVGQNYCRVENFNPEDVNSSVTHFFQLEPTSIRTSSLCDLINTCLEEPCFDILRTREQLGYSVWCSSHLTNNILGLSLNVETSSSKFSLDQVDDKMNSFLDEFAYILSSMKAKEFKTHVKSLIGLKKKEETNLNEEADKYWNEIITQNYVFDRLEKEIEVLSTLTKSELLSWFRTNVLNKDKHKKLVSQVQGSTTSNSAEDDLVPKPRLPLRRYSSISCHGIKVSEHLALKSQQRQQDIDRGGICDLKYLTVGKVPLKNCIMDITTFKRKLPAYPVHKADT